MLLVGFDREHVDPSTITATVELELVKVTTPVGKVGVLSTSVTIAVHVDEVNKTTGVSQVTAIVVGCSTEVATVIMKNPALPKCDGSFGSVAVIL